MTAYTDFILSQDTSGILAYWPMDTLTQSSIEIPDMIGSYPMECDYLNVVDGPAVGEVGAKTGNFGHAITTGSVPSAIAPISISCWVKNEAGDESDGVFGPNVNVSTNNAFSILMNADYLVPPPPLNSMVAQMGTTNPSSGGTVNIYAPRQTDDLWHHWAVVLDRIQPSSSKFY